MNVEEPGKQYTPAMDSGIVMCEPIYSVAAPETIEEAHKRQICTFVITGTEYATQEWKQCITCGLAVDYGICLSCAQVCHKGHDVQPARTSSFYCDCGERGPSKCKCLV